MLGVLEISLVGGVAALGVRRMRHRQALNAIEKTDERSRSTALITDMQTMGNSLVNAVDDTYQRLVHSVRTSIPSSNTKRPLINLLKPDAWVPSSLKVQSTLRYTAISPWKEHEVATLTTDDAQPLLQMTALESKFGLSDARLVARYVRRYWSPYAVVGVATGVMLMGFSAYRLLFAHTLQVVADGALTAGGGCRSKVL